MKQVYVITLKTFGYTAIRVLNDPAKAIREASIMRNNYKGVSWVEIKDGHASTNGNGKTGMNFNSETIKITVKPVTLE